MVIDSKQMRADGSVKLDRLDNGKGAMQLSNDWFENVFNKTGDSEIAERLMNALDEGRVETYVAAADKAAGTMTLIKVDAN